MFIQRPRPIAEQVLDALRARIRGQEFQSDNRLPSESELAAQMHVSRATVRSALTTLAAEKWIIRRQGDGTYVNRRLVNIQTNFGMISDYTRMISSDGHQCRIEVVSLAHRQATSQESSKLEITPNLDVLCLDRLFLADEQPAIYSRNIIPAHLLVIPPTLPLVVEPLPTLIKQFCRQECAYGLSDLKAGMLDENKAAHLKLPANSPVICMEEIFYNDQDQPIVYATNSFNAQVLPLKVGRSFD
jgi:GntR family transcriptional regulator